MKSVFLSSLVLGSAMAAAQFDGPAPLAWRWQYSSPVPPQGSPVVKDNFVYVGVGGRVFCIDRVTGNNKWQFPRLDPLPGVFSETPVIFENTLIAATNQKWVVGIDLATGNEKWRYEAPAGLTGAPVIAGKFLVMGLMDDTLMALDPNNGQPAWENPQRIFERLKGSIGQTGGDILYFNQRDQLVSYNPTTKKSNWRQQFSVVPTTAVPTVFGDIIYTYSANYLVALNARTGSPRFQKPVAQDLDFAPAVSPEGVLAVTRAGLAYVLDSAGNLRTRTPIDLESGPTAPPVSVGKKFIVPTGNGLINLINPADGTVAWSYHVKPATATSANGDQPQQQPGPGGRPQTAAPRVPTVPVYGPPAVAGRTLYVLAADGSLLAFDPENGVDLTSPEVKMLWPNPGDMISGRAPLEFVFRVADDASGVNENNMKITVNGQEMEYEYTRDGFAVVRFTQMSANKELQDGRANVVVDVTDWLGNRTTTTYALTIDNTLAPLGRNNAVPAGDRPGTTKGPKKGGGAGMGIGG